MGYLAQFAESCSYDAVCRVSGEKYDKFINNLVRLMDVKRIILSDQDVCQSEALVLFTALDFVSEFGKHISVAETAKRLNVSMPSVSRSLKSLSEKGYIERDFNENDRRSVRIIVTTSGEEKLREILKRIHDTLDKTLEIFSNEELAQMIDLQNRFVSSLVNTLVSSSA